MQCKPVDYLPAGPEWIYELKFDGYRALAIKAGQTVRLISRNEKDLTSSYPEIVEAVRALPLREGVLDGEIVALDSTGKPSFQGLQHAHRYSRSPRSIYFYAFDLLNCHGKDVTSLSLSRRKELLRELIGDGQDGVRFVEALDGTPEVILPEICRHSLEGIVAKRA